MLDTDLEDARAVILEMKAIANKNPDSEFQIDLLVSEKDLYQIASDLGETITSAFGVHDYFLMKSDDNLIVSVWADKQPTAIREVMNDMRAVFANDRDKSSPVVSRWDDDDKPF